MSEVVLNEDQLRLVAEARTLGDALFPPLTGTLTAVRAAYTQKAVAWLREKGVWEQAKAAWALVNCGTPRVEVDRRQRFGLWLLDALKLIN